MRIILTLLMFASFVWADDPNRGPVFGPEFTFQTPHVRDSLEELTYHVRNHLITKQPEGAKFQAHWLNVYDESDEAFTEFRSPNGWSFTVASDPGVVEVQMAPMHVDDFEKYASDIQDAIFASASNVNMFPGLFAGGGHINIDINYFEKRPPILFRNFLVDWVNHSSLSMGMFGYNTNSALPWVMSPALDMFKYLIELFDKGEFGDIYVPNESTVEHFALTMERMMGEKEETFRKLWGYGDRPIKNTEISTADAHGSAKRLRRVEIRVTRPQASVDVWVRQIKLLRDRIWLLERQHRKPIPLRPSYRLPVRYNPMDFKLDPPIDPQFALREFYTYVTDAGHKWQDHRDYIWPNWVRDPKGKTSELEKFEKSRWFEEREGCRQLLRSRSAA